MKHFLINNRSVISIGESESKLVKSRVKFVFFSTYIVIKMFYSWFYIIHILMARDNAWLSTVDGLVTVYTIYKKKKL